MPEGTPFTPPPLEAWTPAEEAFFTEGEKIGQKKGERPPLRRAEISGKIKPIQEKASGAPFTPEETAWLEKGKKRAAAG